MRGWGVGLNLVASLPLLVLLAWGVAGAPAGGPAGRGHTPLLVRPELGRTAQRAGSAGSRQPSRTGPVRILDAHLALSPDGPPIRRVTYGQLVFVVLHFSYAPPVSAGGSLPLAIDVEPHSPDPAFPERASVPVSGPSPASWVFTFNFPALDFAPGSQALLLTLGDATWRLLFSLALQPGAPAPRPSRLPLARSAYDGSLLALLRAVVAVTVSYPDGAGGQRRGLCAGAWMGRGWVLTAAHCADYGPGAVYAVQSLGATVAPSRLLPAAAGYLPGAQLVPSASRATVLALDRALDVALLQAQPPAGAAPLSLAARAPQPGDAVYTIGFPLSCWWQGCPQGTADVTLATAWNLSVGRVFGADGRTFQFDAAIADGSSGGPVFNADNQLVGIVSGVGGYDGFAAGPAPLRALLAGQGQAPGS